MKVTLEGTTFEVGTFVERNNNEVEALTTALVEWVTKVRSHEAYRHWVITGIKYDRVKAQLKIGSNLIVTKRIAI